MSKVLLSGDNVMFYKNLIFIQSKAIILVFITLLVSGCEIFQYQGQMTEPESSIELPDYNYIIGPGDSLDIFVWRNADVSVTGIPVRPDGRISSPLVDDIIADGKTPTELANDIKEVLSKVIKDPFVTVTVVDFVSGYDQQIRVVGEATTPSALPYRSNMSILDVMIAVGGLTEFAAGNKTTIVRKTNGSEEHFNVRLEDLLKGGDINANVKVYPGDIIVIPESLF
jgi:polysaccharide biosynthesis/export protein